MIKDLSIEDKKAMTSSKIRDYLDEIDFYYSFEDDYLDETELDEDEDFEDYHDEISEIRDHDDIYNLYYDRLPYEILNYFQTE